MCVKTTFWKLSRYVWHFTTIHQIILGYKNLGFANFCVLDCVGLGFGWKQESGWKLGAAVGVPAGSSFMERM